jgi:hypothetical protein
VALLVLCMPMLAQQTVQGVVIGGIQHGTDSLITPYKIEAALALACELSPSYRLIPNERRDSVVRGMGTDSVTVMAVAERLGAELIAFISVGRVANLVRVELVVVGGEGWVVTSTGVGYAVSSFVDDSTGRRVMDPALLSAMQRALCRTTIRPDLYAAADSGFIVRPTTLMATGGFVFAAQDSSLAPWSVFREKIAASYDIASTIVAALRRHDTATVIDIESRDSIYATAGLFMVENYNPPSRSELETLKAFEVTHIITGRAERKRGGADLTLTVNRIDANGIYTPLASATTTVAVDSKLALQDGVRECLRRLFGTITEPAERK